MGQNVNKKNQYFNFLWLPRKSDFMDANLVCKLRTLRENLHWYDEGNKTTVERSEEETLWRIFVFQMWVTEIISYNIGLNLVQLKGSSCSLSLLLVQWLELPHLSMPAGGQGADCHIFDSRASWTDPYKWARNMNWAIFLFKNLSQALFDFWWLAGTFSGSHQHGG